MSSRKATFDNDFVKFGLIHKVLGALDSVSYFPTPAGFTCVLNKITTMEQLNGKFLLHAIVEYAKRQGTADPLTIIRHASVRTTD
jgi:hypothetical protein